MSILGQASSRPAVEDLTNGLLLTLALSVPGFLLAVWFRLYRPSAVAGPMRIPDGQPLWPTVSTLGVTILAYLAVPFAYGIIRVVISQSKSGGDPAATHPASYAFTDRELVLISVVSPIVAIVVAILVGSALQRRLFSYLGLRFWPPMRVMRNAVLGTLVAIPVTLVLGQLVELLYRRINFEHEAEHELLKVMTESDGLTRTLAILAAVMVAPVVEEVLFRGLLQTSIAMAIQRVVRPPPAFPAPGATLNASIPVQLALPPSPEMPRVAAETQKADAAEAADAVTAAGADPFAGSQPPSEGGAVESLPLEAARMHPLASWAAVVITSALFALVHPLWTAPIIFGLALMLGYLYERTGNLWTTILIHAAFNTFNTVYYLAHQGG